MTFEKPSVLGVISSSNRMVINLITFYIYRYSIWMIKLKYILIKILKTSHNE